MTAGGEPPGAGGVRNPPSTASVTVFAGRVKGFLYGLTATWR